MVYFSLLIFKGSVGLCTVFTDLVLSLTLRYANFDFCLLAVSFTAIFLLVALDLSFKIQGAIFPANLLLFILIRKNMYGKAIDMEENTFVLLSLGQGLINFEMFGVTHECIIF